MYKIFEIEWGLQAWVWIDLNNDNTWDILCKKGFEIV
jgi:hypothetical protein